MRAIRERATRLRLRTRLLTTCFRKRGARRLYVYTEDYNTSCQRLCEKLGMRQEGFFREFVTFVKEPDGSPKYENTLQYAILKKEWDRGEKERKMV